MEDIFKKHCIFSLEKELFDVYYHNDTRSLVMRKYVSKMGWQSVELLHENVHHDFDVDLDKQGVFNILCQDTKGGLVVICWKDGNLTYKHILQSKVERSSDKYLKIRCIDNTTHCYFVISDDKGEGILAEIKIDKEVVSKPRVVDKIKMMETPYELYQSDNNVDALYFSAKENSFIYSRNILGDENRRDNLLEFVESDWRGNVKGGAIQVAVLGQNMNGYSFWLKRWIGDVDKKPRVILLHSLKKKPIFWDLVSLDDELILYWFSEQGLLKVSSKDGGITWGKANIHTSSYAHKLEGCGWVIKDYWNGDKRINCIPAIVGKNFSPEFFADRAVASDAQFNQVFPLMNDKFRENESAVKECVDVVNKLSDIYKTLVGRIEKLEKDIAKLEIMFRTK